MKEGEFPDGAKERTGNVIEMVSSEEICSWVTDALYNKFRDDGRIKVVMDAYASEKTEHRNEFYHPRYLRIEVPPERRNEVVEFIRELENRYSRHIDVK